VFEVELKYRVRDVDDLLVQIDSLGGVEGASEQHEDTYFQHPCRDFRQTTEALRIRRIDGRPSVTYKGPKQTFAHDGVTGIKSRRELEWELGPGDPQGENFDLLLRSLGFTEVATVKKRRRTFRMVDDAQPITVVIDHLAGEGWFAELEMICDEIVAREAVAEKIAGLANKLRIGTVEPRSYLRIVLESSDPPVDCGTDGRRG
jgi:adenylate cyclase class 2